MVTRFRIGKVLARSGAWLFRDGAALAMVVAMSLGMIVWLGWSGLRTRSEIQLATQQAVRIAELRGTFRYLDEWLTMSAQMAAVSGDAQWAARYEEARPQLTAAIAEAMRLATPEVSAALAETTTEATRGLTDMEHTAFARAAAGDRAGAEALLTSPEFGYLKAVYASGIDAFGQDLQTLAAARTETLNKRAWMETSALAMSAVFLVAAAFASRGRLQARLALVRMETVARTDALTDLPNRRRLYEDLRLVLAKTKQDSGAAVLLLDLDRFKMVNDVHGHSIGDQLLQLVAARLRSVACAGELVARLGGDEFALVVCLDASAQASVHSETAAQLARRIISRFAEPFKIADGSFVQISVSIGVALASNDGESAEALIRRAEVALYRAKSDGGARFCCFEPSMDVHIQARARLEGELRQAIVNDAIVPYFQPLMELATGRLVGFEMLARWPHPTRGTVSPAEFIPIAEEIGLIGAMTDRLLHRACRCAMTWPADTVLACNISPLQLQDPGLPEMVRAALDHAGLPPHRLELEITESALVGDLALARDLLDELKKLGVRLALDDFGTGYSSLRHLKMLPIDKLKIDASFVATMAIDVESRKIVAAVVGLGASLGLITVAEGVEKLETAALLRDLGCDVGQGYLFGRPCAEDAIGMFLQRLHAS